VQAGATWWLAVVASVLVFAGAAQFMMVSMLAAGFDRAGHAAGEFAPHVLWSVLVEQAAASTLGRLVSGVCPD
jgi:hypothetical protein